MAKVNIIVIIMILLCSRSSVINRLASVSGLPEFIMSVMSLALLAPMTPRISMQNETIDSMVFEFWKLIGGSVNIIPRVQNMTKLI